MDPTTCLAEIRALMKALTTEPQNDVTTDLVMHFLALDQWISEGGFLPKQWVRE